jgi:hypothetical protein
MRNILWIIILGAVGYIAYKIFTEKSDKIEHTGSSPGNGQGDFVSNNSAPTMQTEIGSGSIGNTSTSGTTQTSTSGCAALPETVAFLKKQLADNEEMTRYYENQMQQIREMPLCSTGKANVLGCVENEAERQKLLEGARRQRDYFAGLAEQNRRTLMNAGCL